MVLALFWTQLFCSSPAHPLLFPPDTDICTQMANYNNLSIDIAWIKEKDLMEDK